MKQPDLIVDPKWLEETRDDIILQMELRNGVHPMDGAYEIMRYFPEESGKGIPEEGAWIMIVVPPNTEITVPKLSIWYAMPAIGRLHHEWHIPIKYAVIFTPDGDLRLHAWEYDKVDIGKYIQMIDGEHLKINFMSFDAIVSGIMEEKMFYLRQRGIGTNEAYTMLLGAMQDPNLCWLEFHSAYTECFQGVREPWDIRN